MDTVAHYFKLLLTVVVVLAGFVWFVQNPETMAGWLTALIDLVKRFFNAIGTLIDSLVNAI